jgi:hypothetical protein
MASEPTHGAEQISKNPSRIHSASRHDAKDAHKGAATNGFVRDSISQASENVAKANDIHRETTELTAERVKCLLSVYTNYAHGLLEMQQAYADLIHRSMELTQRVTRELIRCTSPSDLAEVQRDMLREGMDQVFEGTTKILQASSKAAGDAIRPIEEQLKHAA